jgi:hypothetical protein
VNSVLVLELWLHFAKNKMENTQFYIKYLDNQPVQISTHINNDKTAYRVFPLENVGDLVAAYKAAVAPLLDHSSLAQLTLHLPINADRSTISEDCFASIDSNDTTLVVETQELIVRLFIGDLTVMDSFRK